MLDGGGALNRLRGGAVALVVMCLATVGAAQGHLDDRLAGLLRAVPAGTRVGLAVADVETRRVVFASRADEPLKPASVMKLFVTAAALERFGTDFRFETPLYVHEDELWILGSGDPALADERIARRHGFERLFPIDGWSAVLERRGQDRFAKLVLDDSVFAEEPRHPDWPTDQNARWYQAPVGGLNLNDNCLDSRVEVAGGAIHLILVPPIPESFVSSSLRLGQRHRPIVRRGPGNDVFEFVGTVSKSSALGPAAVARPTVFFGHAVKHTFAQRGIRIDGAVVRRRLRPSDLAEATLVARHSTPMRDVLWRCNTFSQNLFAECLLKALVAYEPDGTRSGRSGSWQAGTQELARTLRRLGVDLSGATLRDGSGLSHQNRVTAGQVVGLLVALHHHRQRAAFVESLAVPGRPGSMRRRYAHPILAEHLRGKTGSLSGVRTLAGYVTRPDGRTLAFTVLCNGRISRGFPGRVARLLVEADLPG